MKKVVIGLLLLLLWITPIALWAAEPDFRNATWGMTPGEVEWSESLRVLRRDEQSMTYNAAYEGLDCLLVYIFHKNKLVGGGYSFTHSRSYPSEYVDDYYRIKDSLIRKHGRPFEEQTLWKDDFYKNNPGKAIMTGGLELNSVWRRGDTAIGLKLSGKNNQLEFIVGYYSIEGMKKRKADGLGGL